MSVYKNELNLLCIPWMISQSPKAAWATDFCYCSSDPRDPTSTKRFGLTACGHSGSWRMPLPHSSSKSHRGEGHVSTGGGSAQICVDKTKDTPRKIGNAKLVGMISASWFCNAAQGCVGVCKWIRTQQWIKLSKGSLPRKDIGSGWWLIEANSQEITFCQWSFLYSQQLHR